MEKLPAVDIAVLVVYILSVVGLGCWFVRKSQSTSEFTSAGGSIPGWAVGLSIFGTYLSSNTFIGVPGMAYGTNWYFFTFSLSLPIAAYFATKYFVPFYRNSGEISAYHHLEDRFGGWARIYMVACYLLTQIARVGSILLAVSLTLSELTGWPTQSIIIGAGVLITLYTLMGGIEAVIWTDVIQSIVLVVGALVITGLLLFANDSFSASEILKYAYDNGKMSLGSFDFNFSRDASNPLVDAFAYPSFWVVIFYGVFNNLNNFGIDQNFVQRYHTAKTEAAARWSVWFGALVYVPIALLFFFIGAVLFGYYGLEETEHATIRQNQAKIVLQRIAKKTDGQMEGEDIGPVTDMTDDGDYIFTDEQISKKADSFKPKEYGDTVLPYFIVNNLPKGFVGLLIAAIFAAAMSSVDTSLNSSATITLEDLYKRFINKNPDEKKSMRVLQGATLFWGVGGTVVAISLIGVDSILKAWTEISGIFAGGMFGLFLLGRVVPRAKKPAALTAVLIGLVVIIWMTFSGDSKWMPDGLKITGALRSPFHAYMIMVFGTLTIFFVGLIVSKLSGNGDSDKAETTANASEA